MSNKLASRGESEYDDTCVVISISAFGSGFGFGGGAGVPAFALSSCCCCCFFLLLKSDPRPFTTASDPLVGTELPESVDLELSLGGGFEEACDVFEVPGCGGMLIVVYESIGKPLNASEFFASSLMPCDIRGSTWMFEGGIQLISFAIFR